MPRSSNQKVKLLYVMQYLMQETDAEHPAPTGKILEYLTAQGIQAERKSIYDDIEALRLFGMDIEQNESKRSGGYEASRNDGSDDIPYCGLVECLQDLFDAVRLGCI